MATRKKKATAKPKRKKGKAKKPALPRVPKPKLTKEERAALKAKEKIEAEIRLERAIEHARASQERLAQKRREQRERKKERERAKEPEEPKRKWLESIRALSEDIDGTFKHYPGYVEIVVTLPPEASLIDLGDRVSMTGHLTGIRGHVVFIPPSQKKGNRPYRTSRVLGPGYTDGSTAWHDALWDGISAICGVIDNFRALSIEIVNITVEMRFGT